jgi:hypothetical protein
VLRQHLPGRRAQRHAGQRTTGQQRPAPRRTARGRIVGEDFGGRPAQDGARDLRTVFHVRAQQRAVAQQVDPARHAMRQAMHQWRERRREWHADRAGHGQPVRDVGARFGFAQWPQVVACDHALGQLFEFGARKHRAQFGLADQDDLEQLAFAGLEIGQQAQLLEHVARQVLRLVDHQHVVQALCVRRQQVAVDRIHIPLYARASSDRRHLDMQLVAHGLQQLLRRQARIEDVGQAAVRGHLLDEAAADRGLAGADLAGEQHEAAAAADPVQQVRQCFAVPLAHEQVARIGGDRKWRVRELEVVVVHG